MGISAFYHDSAAALIDNTSLNVKGDRIVCSPEDASQCFMLTEMDYLAMGNLLFEKSKQPSWSDQDLWREEFRQD